MKGLSLSEPMVKAWLAGNKAVTRRLMNPQPTESVECIHGIWCEQWDVERGDGYVDQDARPLKQRYFPGETVYIKETWARIWNQDGCLNEDYDQCPIDCEGCHIEYKADTGAKYPAEWPDDSTGDPSCPKWKSPAIMPETASRSHALIVSVRPERVQEITEEDARREGVTPFRNDPEGDCWTDGKYRTAFEYLWNEIHGWNPNSFASNPFVWRIELKKEGL